MFLNSRRNFLVLSHNDLPRQLYAKSVWQYYVNKNVVMVKSSNTQNEVFCFSLTLYPIQSKNWQVDLNIVNMNEWNAKVGDSTLKSFPKTICLAYFLKVFASYRSSSTHATNNLLFLCDSSSYMEIVWENLFDLILNDDFKTMEDTHEFEGTTNSGTFYQFCKELELEYEY
jgi:hypothetical protein